METQSPQAQAAEKAKAEEKKPQTTDAHEVASPVPSSPALAEDTAALLAESTQRVQKTRDLQVGQKVSGKVVKVGSSNFFVDLGQKSEAAVEIPQWKKALPAEGDTVEAFVLAVAPDGTVSLGSQLSASDDAQAAIENAYHSKIPVEGKVVSRNKGGLEVVIFGKRAFCPASHIELRRCDNPEQYLHQVLRFEIIELKENGKKIVLSRRGLLEEETRKAKEELFAKIAPEAELDGKITSRTDYGIFVDLGGGIEGLVHVSEISHTRVDDPKKAYPAGALVRVKVLRVDRSDPKGERISLSMKALESDPWRAASSHFSEGALVKGKVVRLENFGAFVELAPGVDGLVHISELSAQRVGHPSEVIQIGENYDFKVIRNEPEKRRIGLSLREAQGYAAPTSAPSKYEPTGYDSQEIEEGNIVDAEIEKVESFGLFARLPGGKKGMIPNAEMGTPRDTDHTRDFPKGTKIQVKVIRIDPQTGKIRLSRKAIFEDEEQREIQEYTRDQGNKRSFGKLGDKMSDFFSAPPRSRK